MNATDFYTVSPDGGSITCTVCCFTSFNPIDVREKFCPRCKVLHEARPAIEQARRHEMRRLMAGRLRGETLPFDA